MNAKTSNAHLNVLLIGFLLAAWGSMSPARGELPVGPAMKLEFGKSLPLTIQSHAVVWKEQTFHLVQLSSGQFNLDKQTGRLQADVNAFVTCFDNVHYEISAAVFNAQGALLGTARSPCEVQRLWTGRVLCANRVIALDFGSSKDYSAATGFLISISRQSVVTPEAWQK